MNLAKIWLDECKRGNNSGVSTDNKVRYAHDHIADEAEGAGTIGSIT